MAIRLNIAGNRSQDFRPVVLPRFKPGWRMCMVEMIVLQFRELSGLVREHAWIREFLEQHDGFRPCHDFVEVVDASGPGNRIVE